MTAQLSPNRVALPPPLEMDLVHAEREVGWISRDRVGFRGFADELEAAHAAWVAHRTLARRLARTHGTRPLPIDVEPLSIRQVAGAEMILAGGKPIAELVRPGEDSRAGPDSFGFEISVPPPTDELRVRSMSHLMYRTLRKSGIRWALWRPPVASALPQTSAVTNVAPESAPAASPVAGDSVARARPKWWALPAAWTALVERRAA